MFLDKSISSVADRINFVKGTLESEGAFSFKDLERMADYILTAKDAPRDKKQEYNYYKNRKLFEKIVRESSGDVLAIYVDPKFGRHDIIPKDQKILKSDYNDPIIGSAMRDYNDAIMAFKSNDDFKSKRYVCQTKKDQLLYKTQRKGTIYFKQVCPGSTVVAWDLFNFTDEEHIQALLKFNPRNLKNHEVVDLSELIYDLECLLSKCRLSEEEKTVLNLWRDDDSTQESIAEVLGISRFSVMRRLNSIVRKVIKQYQLQYEDWIYLNYIPGTYKKCSNCRTVKLISRFGKHHYCKACR